MSTSMAQVWGITGLYIGTLGPAWMIAPGHFPEICRDLPV